MEVSLLFKIGAVGILVSVLCQILKHSQREELAFLTSLTGLLLVLFWVLPYIYDLFHTIENLFVLKFQEYFPIDAAYLTALLKMTGITYISEFASGICKDAGYSAIASQIEVFAKLYIMVLSMPVLLALIETIHGFLS